MYLLALLTPQSGASTRTDLFVCLFVYLFLFIFSLVFSVSWILKKGRSVSHVAHKCWPLSRLRIRLGLGKGEGRAKALRDRLRLLFWEIL